MRFIRFPALALLCSLVPLSIACNEDNTLGLGPGNDTKYNAALSGGSIRPTPVTTPVTGIATITVSEPDIGQSESTLAYTIDIAGLTSATAAHIHLGGAAIANGQILATLFTNAGDTSVTAGLRASGSLSPSAISVTLDSLTTLMTNGTAYVDIHTTANPSGLIRGQLVKSGEAVPGELFAARSLSGAKERPTPVTTTATGLATFTAQSTGLLRFTVVVAGITGVTAAHIHTAVADSAGPIAVPLFATTTPTGSLTGTLANGSFTEANIQIPGVALDSLLSLMRRGRAYVDVHTQLNPSGEIRAQVEPVSILP